jgi:hypothetical protein
MKFMGIVFCFKKTFQNIKLIMIQMSNSYFNPALYKTFENLECSLKY